MMTVDSFLGELRLCFRRQRSDLLQDALESERLSRGCCGFQLRSTVLSVLRRSGARAAGQEEEQSSLVSGHRGHGQLWDGKKS